MFSLFTKLPAVYRPIGPERSAECASVHAASFAYAWDEADFEQLLTGSEIVADGAVEPAAERLLGFALSRFALDEAEILTIAVAPDWRGYGVGRTLLAIHLAGLSAHGVVRVFLEVEPENAAARGLYAARGFRQVGERKAYYRKTGAPPASALVMRLDLNAQV